MKQKQFRINTILNALLVAFILGISAVLLVVGRQGTVESQNHLTDNSITRTVEVTEQRTKRLLDEATATTSLMQLLAPTSLSLPDNSGEMVTLLMYALHAFPDVYTVYFGNEQGDFFLVGKRKLSPEDEQKTFFVKRVRNSRGERDVTENWYDNDYRLIKVTELAEDIYDPRVRPWYVKAKREGTRAWSDPYLFFITGKPGITYAVPVQDSDGFRGVIAADLEVSVLSAQLENNLFTENTVSFVIGEHGNIIAHSSVFAEGTQEAAVRREIPTITNLGDPVLASLYENDMFAAVGLLEVSGEEYKFFLDPVKINGLEMQIGIYTPTRDYMYILNKITNRTYLVALVAILIAILVGTAFSRSLAGPFQKLIKASNLVGDLDFDRSIWIGSNIREVQEAEANFNVMLESLRNYSDSNDVLTNRLERSHLDTLYRLALAAEHKDQYTSEHLNRVSSMSVLLAEFMDLPHPEIELIRHASAMHDVGKIGIPDHILMKKGRLSAEEFAIIKEHSEIGAKILENPSSEIMKFARVVALSHHERWDGQGYPHGLKGEEIPLEARITSLADVVDALMSSRTYKEAYSFKKTVEIIQAERGKHFDPQLVDLFVVNQERFQMMIAA